MANPKPLPKGSRARYSSIANFLIAEMEEREINFPSEPGEQVYFIGADDGPVKIGRSTCVEARLGQFQAGCPVKLRVLAVVTGGRALERAYHAHFAAQRLHGEWFSRCPAMEQEIKHHAW